MSRIAFIFPGQGSQYVGMGKAAAATEAGGRLFREADAALGFSLSGLCFNGPEEDLKQTYNTQPAVLTVSLIADALLREKGIVPEMTAGHSLGEYSALASAGALSFAEAVRLVRKRGQIMAETTARITGAGMAAIMGLSAEDVVAVCREASAAGVVEAVNFNSPVQTIISGTKSGIDKAIEIATAKGAKRAMALPVSAPFHSSLMNQAAELFRPVLEAAAVTDAEIPVVANVTAAAETAAAEIRANLIAQVNGPVRWTESAQAMLAAGIDTFIEVGPGKVLSGLMGKISKEAKVFAVETPESIDALAAQLS